LTSKGGISGERQVSKVLHDYLYSLVEGALGRLVRDINSFSGEDWRTGLVHQTLRETQADFIWVTGQVKIVDFMGLAVQLESMARLMQAFQQFPTSQQGARQPQPKSKNRGGKGQSPTARNQDEMIIQMVSLIKEFYGDLIVLKMFPLPDDDDYYFTGALGKEGLQDERAHMLLKFGATPSAPWTMLAQVASVPPQSQTTAVLQSGELPTLSLDQCTDISDAIGKMVDAIAQIFAATGVTMTVKYPVIAVTPLAIYRV
jgi:hypothetical protein